MRHPRRPRQHRDNPYAYSRIIRRKLMKKWARMFHRQILEENPFDA